MKTFLVPMFAIVEAEDASAADDIVAASTPSARLHGVLFLLDETLPTQDYDPAVLEPHSVLDVPKIAAEARLSIEAAARLSIEASRAP